MGLLGGLFGGGSKSSSTSSSQTDNRRVMGDGSASFEVSGGGSATFVQSDLGAIQAAQRMAQESAQAGAEVARSALGGAFGFGSDAVGLSADALGFGAKAMTDALDFSSSTFGLVDSVVSNAVNVVARRAGEEGDSLRSIYETALGQISSANDRLGTAYADSQGRGSLTDKMLMMAIAGAVVIAVVAVREKG